MSDLIVVDREYANVATTVNDFAEVFEEYIDECAGVIKDAYTNGIKSGATSENLQVLAEIVLNTRSLANSIRSQLNIEFLKQIDMDDQALYEL